MLDKPIVFEAPDINRTHCYVGARSPHANERSGVASPIGVTACDAVADSECIFDDYARVGKGIEPVSHELNQARETGLDAGIVVHVVFGNELGEAGRIVAIHNVGKQVG